MRRPLRKKLAFNRAAGARRELKNQFENSALLEVLTPNKTPTRQPTIILAKEPLHMVTAGRSALPSTPNDQPTNQLLRLMRQLIGGTSAPQEGQLLPELFLQRLPQSMVPVLVAADVPVDTLTEMADRVADYLRAHSFNAETTLDTHIQPRSLGDSYGSSSTEGSPVAPQHAAPVKEEVGIAFYRAAGAGRE
ncbi:hypothetical protein HPB50_009190 [Hyalomma asiaticum]|uniref:Uncharacterized protein n=1 Tax=Hyalomma asiaticum TaxID=266040 RepID=A0ACB7SHX9_HYAAI|nr:hypothetical protein HPB50_009190 [Hyalomma asiaticum]